MKKSPAKKSGVNEFTTSSPSTKLSRGSPSPSKNTTTKSMNSSSSPTKVMSPSKRTTVDTTTNKSDSGSSNNNRSVAPKRNANTFSSKSSKPQIPRQVSPKKKKVTTTSSNTPIKEKKSTIEPEVTDPSQPQTTKFSIKNLNDDQYKSLSARERIEYEVLSATNLLRTQPEKCAEMLELRLPYYRDDKVYAAPGSVMIMTNEGKKAVQEAINILRNTKPMPPLVYSPGLSLACRDHCKDHGPKGKIGHNGSDGSQFYQRCARYGKFGAGTSGENISYGSDSGLSIVLQLTVDDGVESRGHRENLLNTSFTVCGIGFRAHKTYEYMCVIDYGVTYTEKGM
jgi:uncharacterized protein YkwD